MNEQIEVLRLEIGKLEMDQDDILIIKVHDNFPKIEHLERFIVAMRESFPDLKFMVVDHTMDFSVVKQK